MFIIFWLACILLPLQNDPGVALLLLYYSVLYLVFWRIPAESTKAKVIKIIAAGCLVVAGGYILNKFPLAWFKLLSAPPWEKRLFWTALAAGVAAGGVSLARRMVGGRDKESKHGPAFSLPTLSEKNVTGITIGTSYRGVLPKLLQPFCSLASRPVVMAYDRLSRNTTILGDMGSGKSRLLFAIEAGIRKQYPDIPVLIHDPKGEWLRTCYDPATDLIFAPHDERSCGWKIWEDFKQHPELRHSLITTAVEAHHSGNTDRFWNDSATQLLKTAVSKPDVDLAKKFLLLKKQENGQDKTFQSVYATAQLAFRDIAATEFLSRKTATAKTIDEFLNHKGRIFLLNNPSCAAEQRGALSLLLSAFLLQAISKADTKETELRAAAVIDEALPFHLPAEVERIVYSQSRSKGLAIIAAAQRLPDPAYNERGMWAGSAYHYFAMRVSDLKSRETLSQRAGRLIYEEETESRAGGWNGTSTTSKTERQYSAIPPESFGALNPREFILFHQNGICPGVVGDVPAEQRGDIKPIQYTSQDAALEYLADL